MYKKSLKWMIFKERENFGSEGYMYILKKISIFSDNIVKFFFMDTLAKISQHIFHILLFQNILSTFFGGKKNLSICVR